MNSRSKGKRGELEAARFLSAAGFAARRGRQYAGAPEAPDVICPALTRLHFEVKRTQRVQLYEWMDKARADAGSGLPVVLYRRNRAPWLVVLDASDFLRILSAPGATEPAQLTNEGIPS